MAQQFQFDVVSPEQLVLSSQVEMVILPGSEGDMGILPGHARLITPLRPGIIVVYTNNTVQQRIFITGGFGEVTETRCIALVEESVPLEKIDRAEAERNIQNARDDLIAAKDEAERKAAERRIAIEEAKLAALSNTVY